MGHEPKGMNSKAQDVFFFTENSNNKTITIQIYTISKSFLSSHFSLQFLNYYYFFVKSVATNTPNPESLNTHVFCPVDAVNLVYLVSIYKKLSTPL